MRLSPPAPARCRWRGGAGWLACTAMPVYVATILDVRMICFVSMSQWTGKRCGRVRSAITTSSRDVLPARSPSELRVTSTCLAPAHTGAVKRGVVPRSGARRRCSSGASRDCGERVCSCEAEVVVAVGGPDDAVCALDVCDQVREERRVPIRQSRRNEHR